MKIRAKERGSRVNTFNANKHNISVGEFGGRQRRVFIYGTLLPGMERGGKKISNGK